MVQSFVVPVVVVELHLTGEIASNLQFSAPFAPFFVLVAGACLIRGFAISPDSVFSMGSRFQLAIIIPCGLENTNSRPFGIGDSHGYCPMG